MRVQPDEESHDLRIRKGFNSFRAQLDQHHPVYPGATYNVVLRGVVDLYS